MQLDLTATHWDRTYSCFSWDIFPILPRNRRIDRYINVINILNMFYVFMLYLVCHLHFHRYQSGLKMVPILVFFRSILPSFQNPRMALTTYPPIFLVLLTLIYYQKFHIISTYIIPIIFYIYILFFLKS